MSFLWLNETCIWLNGCWHIGTLCHYFKHCYCYWLSHSFLFLIWFLWLFHVPQSMPLSCPPKLNILPLLQPFILNLREELEYCFNKPWNQSFEMGISIIPIFILENWVLREGKPNSQDHTASKHLKYLNCDSNQILQLNFNYTFL